MGAVFLQLTFGQKSNNCWHKNYKNKFPKHTYHRNHDSNRLKSNGVVNGSQIISVPHDGVQTVRLLCKYYNIKQFLQKQISLRHAGIPQRSKERQH